MVAAVNEEYVQGRQTVRRRAFWLGFLLMGVAIYLNFTNSNFFTLTWPLLIIGFVASNVSRQAQFQLGIGESTHRRLARALKPLNNRYWLGSYIPSGNKDVLEHLLVGPEGVLVLLPRNHTRQSTYRRGRWSRSSGRFLRILGVEPGLGNPTRELEQAVELARADLEAAGFSEDEVPISGAVVFTSPDAQLDLEDCPITALTAKQLEAWASRHRPAPNALISEPLRNKLVEHFASRLPGAPLPRSRAA